MKNHDAAYYMRSALEWYRKLIQIPKDNKLLRPYRQQLETRAELCIAKAERLATCDIELITPSYPVRVSIKKESK